MTVRSLIQILILAAPGCSDTTTSPTDETPLQRGSISGTVLTQTDGRPIVGLSVTITPGGRATVTNALGQFTIADLEADSYTVLVSGDGFGSVSSAVTLSASRMEADLDLFLSPLGPPPGEERLDIRKTITQGTLGEGETLTYVVELLVLPGESVSNVTVRDTLDSVFGPRFTEDRVQLNLSAFPDANFDVSANGRSLEVVLGTVNPTEGFVPVFTLTIPSPPADDLYCNTAIVTAGAEGEINPEDHTMCIT